MNKQFEEMNIEELNAKLDELKELLDEYLEERVIMLGQSGHHISSTKLVKKYAALIEETEASIKSLEECISAARTLRKSD